MKRSKSVLIAYLMAAAGTALAQKVELIPVLSKAISQIIELPGEFLPYQSVDIHAKVRGYVERVLVDRGTAVKQNQVLALLTAPEMTAQIAEAESKIQAAEAERLQAEAQLTGTQSTYDRLKKAAQTPGAISGNELIQAEQQVKASVAAVQSKRQMEAAVAQAAKVQSDLQAYLRITSPFSGIVTDRMVHPGALVGPGGADPVLLVVQDVSRLRLVVAVPEQNVGGIVKGARVKFYVPAAPQRTYMGTVARLAHSLDEKTRTMAVELDVSNKDGSLSPGMYPSLQWPVRRPTASLLVPKTSVVTTTERIFVVRSRSGRAEWVNVTKGVADGDLVEVLGNLKAGELIVRRATDEIREGTSIQP